MESNNQQAEGRSAFALALINIRTTSGHSIETISKEMGVSPTVWAAIEDGIAVPWPRTHINYRQLAILYGKALVPYPSDALIESVYKDLLIAANEDRIDRLQAQIADLLKRRG